MLKYMRGVVVQPSAWALKIQVVPPSDPQKHQARGKSDRPIETPSTESGGGRLP